MRTLLAAALLWQTVAAAQAPPTREYVYLGGRLVAIEAKGAVTVAVNCNSAVPLGAGESRTCTAAVTGSTNTSVTWSVVSGGGSISAGGVYTAATVSAPTAVQVKAVWQGDGVSFGTGDLSVNPILAPVAQSVPNTGQAGLLVQVTRTGAWTAVSNDPSMITIQSGASGSGTGTVTYSVSGNSGGSGRTGTMTIAGNTFTVTQSAGGTAVLSPASANVGNAAGSGTVTVTVNGPWAASSDAAWVSVSPGSGTDNGAVTFTYLGNTGAARSATLTIGNTAFGITQAAGATGTLSPTSAAVGSASGSGTISLTVSGPWTATSDAIWVTPSPASGSGSGTVTYSYLTNTGSARSATLTIGNAAFAVTQAACALSLNPVAASVAATSGNFSVAVTSGCASWSVTSDAAWLTVGTPSGGGNGTVSYAVTANAGAQRTGRLYIGGMQFPVTQAAGATYEITPSSVTLYQGNSQQFDMYQVQNGVKTKLTGSATWTLSPPMGTIVDGLYTAPTSFTPGQQVIVTGAVSGLITLQAFVTLQPLGAPSNMTIYPSSGSGASRQFNLYAYYSSTWDLSQNPARYVLFHTTNTTTVNGCYVLWYMVGTNGSLYLGNDEGTGWASGPSTMPVNTTTPASVGPENSQCSLDINASGQRNDVSNYLRLMLMVYFKPAFAGGKSIFYRSGNETNWWTIGSWTVTPQ